MLSLEVVQGGADRDVRRFWYRNYIQRLGICSPHADDANQELFDPLAELGDLFLARDANGQICGTSLVVRADRGKLGHYEDYFGFSGRRREITFSSKLIVAPDSPDPRLALRIACAMYRRYLSSGVRIDYMDCQSRNRRLFERLGYRVARGGAHHPIYGPSVRLTLALRDVDHLRRCGSPFLRAWRERASFRERKTKDSATRVAPSLVPVA